MNLVEAHPQAADTRPSLQDPEPADQAQPSPPKDGGGRARPMARTTLAAYYAEHMCRAIADGGYAPGSAFYTATMIDHYGVSRSVVREALQLLKAKGIVQAKPNTGIIVQPVSRWTLLDPELAAWLSGTDVGGQLANAAADFAAALQTHPDLAANPFWLTANHAVTALNH